MDPLYAKTCWYQLLVSIFRLLVFWKQIVRFLNSTASLPHDQQHPVVPLWLTLIVAWHVYRRKHFTQRKINNEHAFAPCKQVDTSVSHCFSLVLGDLITSQDLQEFHPMTTLITHSMQPGLQTAPATADWVFGREGGQGANRTLLLSGHTPLINVKMVTPLIETFLHCGNLFSIKDLAWFAMSVVLCTKVAPRVFAYVSSAVNTLHF